jgi:hypothetical protein
VLCDVISICSLSIRVITYFDHSDSFTFVGNSNCNLKCFFPSLYFTGISKKLEAAAKKKGSEDIREWIKSVTNHVYWVATSSGDDGDLKKAKLLSVLNHITDVHDGHSETFPKCLHPPITEDRLWLENGTFYPPKIMIW